MPKTMAVIENGIVTNTVWCSDDTAETEELKETYEKKISIGDTYTDGLYYRNGSEVLSIIEEFQNSVDRLKNELNAAYTVDELNALYEEGVNSI